jgi:quinol monooxygenase YgiN
MFALLVRFRAQKGKDKGLEQLFQEMTEKVRQNEKDTLMYDLHRKTDDPAEMFLYERYTDREAWEVTHRSTPYFKKLREALPTYIEGELEVIQYEVVEVK